MGDSGPDREPCGHPLAIDPDTSHSAADLNFEFAFNSRNFSDRVLRIEIMDGPSGSKSGNGDVCGNMSVWRNRKRRREEIGRDKDFAVCNTELILNCDRPDLEDGAASEINDGESVAMIEGSPSGDEAAPTNDSPQTMDFSISLRVRSLYVSSAILAAKSPFFFKLFSNGMQESDQRHAILRINFSEEAALLDLLSYMYSGRLSATTAPALLDVLIAADKFEVASCMRYCSKMLLNLPMTPESALLYLDLPSNISVASAVQPLTEAAKDFLAARYKDMTKSQDEAMCLPLAGIEAIIGSDDLEAPSEDAVFDFVLKWARVQYPNIEDRRAILGSRLSHLIRFPHMNCRKLKKVLACNDLDHELATKLVLEALFFKAESPHRQRALALEDFARHRFTQRAYKYRPLKVIEFEHPHLQCIVFLDLKREELSNLFPLGRVYSQAFHLGGQGFFLSAHCNMDQQSSFHCFGLFLGMQEKGVVSLTVDYEFSARTRPSGEFVSKYKGCYTFTGGKAVGYRNLFGIPWASFLADDSLYLINDMLHLKAELTIKQPQLQPQPPP